MGVESIQAKLEEPDEDEAPPKSPERQATGPLADEEPGEPPVDFEALLEQLSAERNPEEKVNVAAERERVSRGLEHVDTLLEREKEENQSLEAVRQGLQVPHEDSGAVKKLEEAKARLEEEQGHIELAAEWNDVLDSFSELSGGELQHIADTGMTRKGKAIYNKHGKELHSNLAKELARMHLAGGRHVTWGQLRTLRMAVDRILHDIGSVVKGIFKGSGQEQGSSGNQKGTA